jgi:hypothetical protein
MRPETYVEVIQAAMCAQLDSPRTPGTAIYRDRLWFVTNLERGIVIGHGLRGIRAMLASSLRLGS